MNIDVSIKWVMKLGIRVIRMIDDRITLSSKLNETIRKSRVIESHIIYTFLILVMMYAVLSIRVIDKYNIVTVVAPSILLMMYIFDTVKVIGNNDDIHKIKSKYFIVDTISIIISVLCIENITRDIDTKISLIFNIFNDIYIALCDSTELKQYVWLVFIIYVIVLVVIFIMPFCIGTAYNAMKVSHYDKDIIASGIKVFNSKIVELEFKGKVIDRIDNIHESISCENLIIHITKNNEDKREYVLVPDNINGYNERWVTSIVIKDEKISYENISNYI